MGLFSLKPKRTSDVFGISTDILPDSYVDRGSLDAEIQKQLERPNHIALRGESKCGKSWIRQRNVPDAIVIQCRLRKDPISIYRDILAELGIAVLTERTTAATTKGTVEVSGSIGKAIILAVAAKLGIEISEQEGNKYEILGKGPDDLRFVCEVIKESGRRVVIEDFHYMSIVDRKSFAFDLKTMWDYKTYIIIVGVWSQSNMLIFLNPDLAGRVEEISIYWSDTDLGQILALGGTALHLNWLTNSWF